jgi:hypothetical protein
MRHRYAHPLRPAATRQPRREKVTADFSRIKAPDPFNSRLAGSVRLILAIPEWRNLYLDLNN